MGEKEMDKASKSGPIYLPTMETGKKVKCKVKVHIHGLTAESIQETGMMICLKEKEPMNGLMALDMKVNGFKTSKRDMEPILVQKVRNTLETGKEEKEMEMAYKSGL